MKRLHFSIGTLLSLVLLIGLVLSLVLTRISLVGITEKHRNFLRNSDWIEPLNSSDVHVRTIKQAAPLVFQFQISVPEGQKLPIAIVSGPKSRTHTENFLIGTKAFGNSNVEGGLAQKRVTVYLTENNGTLKAGIKIDGIEDDGDGGGGLIHCKESMDWLKHEKLQQVFMGASQTQLYDANTYHEIFWIYDPSEPGSADQKCFKVIIGAFDNAE